MAFPRYNPATITVSGAASTFSFSAKMPAVVGGQNGLLLSVTVVSDNGLGVPDVLPTPVGWTPESSWSWNAGSLGRQHIFKRVADGTEGSSFIKFNLNPLDSANKCYWAAQVWQFWDWEGTLASIQADVNTRSDAPNPGLLNPGWPVEDVLWGVCGGHFKNGARYATQWPAGFTIDQRVVGSPGPSGQGGLAWSALSEVTASQIDPEPAIVFSPSGGYGMGAVFGIRPGTAGENPTPPIIEKRYVNTDNAGTQDGLTRDTGYVTQAAFEAAYPLANKDLRTRNVQVQLLCSGVAADAANVIWGNDWIMSREQCVRVMGDPDAASGRYYGPLAYSDQHYRIQTTANAPVMTVPANYMRFEGIQIVCLTNMNSVQGIYGEGGIGHIIDGCRIRGPRYRNAGLDYGDGSSTYPYAIRNCIINGWNTGIDLSSNPSGVRSTNIYNNTFFDNSGSGIYIRGLSNFRPVIKNNTFYENGNDLNALAGSNPVIDTNAGEDAGVTGSPNGITLPATLTDAMVDPVNADVALRNVTPVAGGVIDVVGIGFNADPASPQLDIAQEDRDLDNPSVGAIERPPTEVPFFVNADNVGTQDGLSEATGYTTLGAAITAYAGKDLVATKTRAVFECSGVAIDAGTAVFNAVDWTTSKRNNITVRANPNSATGRYYGALSWSENHYRKKMSAYSQLDIHVPHVTVDGLQIWQTGLGGRACIYIGVTDDISVINCRLRGNGGNAYGVRAAYDWDYLKGIYANNLVFDCEFGLEMGGRASVSIEAPIYNNTVWDCVQGIRFNMTDVTAWEAIAKNNALFDNVTDIANTRTVEEPYYDSNAGEDTPPVGTFRAQTMPSPLTLAMVDPQAATGSEDVTPVVGGVLDGTGVGYASDMRVPTTDIRGWERDFYNPSIGAIEQISGPPPTTGDAPLVNMNNPIGPRRLTGGGGLAA